MEAGLEVYRARFAGVQSDLGEQVTQGLKLIQELLETLDRTGTLLAKTKLDLDNERDTRRRLQKEVRENRERKGRQEKRPFLVAVIDAGADGYVFRDSYITLGEKGGEDAADALHAALQRYMHVLTGVPSSMDIVVRAFADVSGLGHALVRQGRLQDTNQLRAFATGFSNRQVLFDFLDVGPGQERLHDKIRENVNLFVESSQCKQIVIACGHDTDYAPFLGHFVRDKQVVERITLLEGSTFPAAIKKLGLKRTRFPSMFAGIAQPSVVSGSAESSWSSVAAAKRPTGSDPGPSQAFIASFTGYRNPKAQTNRFGPILTDHSGRRVDRPLQANEAVVERIKKRSLCFFLYLRGECVSSSCRSNHNKDCALSNEEFDALWWLARQQECFKNRKGPRAGPGCSDPMCVYGHRSGMKA